MLTDLFLPLTRWLAVCASITGAWLLLYHYEPVTANFLADLIQNHSVALGATIVLGIICIDARIVGLRNAIGQRTVGAKSRAQSILGGRS